MKYMALLVILINGSAFAGNNTILSPARAMIATDSSESMVRKMTEAEFKAIARESVRSESFNLDGQVYRTTSTNLTRGIIEGFSSHSSIVVTRDGSQF